MDLKSVDVSAGLNWYSCGWQLFKKAPAMWLVMIIMLVAISFLLVLLPLVGQLVLMLIGPALAGGFYFAVRSADQGGPVEPMMLFQGLRDPSRRNLLLALGALTLAVGLAGMLLMVLTMAGGGMMAFGPPEGAGMHGGTGIGWIIGLLLMLALELAVIMAMIYAIPLVMLRGAAPLEAIKASLSACARNLLPLLVFGIINAVLVIIALIPFALGLLILVPVTLCAIYCSYKDIFGDQ